MNVVCLVSQFSLFIRVRGKDSSPSLLPTARGQRQYVVNDEKAPLAKRRSELRKRDAALLYELEMESHKVGWQDPALVYDEEKDFFRFRDGRSPSPASTPTGHYRGRGDQ
jgi:hypothetical protein